MSTIFEDHFDRRNPVWNLYHSTYGDSNNELQHYRPENVSFDSVDADGGMTITAKRESYNGREFTSGFVSTTTRPNDPSKATLFPAFATYEIRCAVPHGQGAWPAFWLRHGDGASTLEIDVLEFFHTQRPGQRTATLHDTGDDGEGKNVKDAKAHHWVEEPVQLGEMHDYGVRLEPDGARCRLTWTFDGADVHSYLIGGTDWFTEYDQDHCLDMAINLAIGGNYVGHPDDDLGWSRWLNKRITYADVDKIRRLEFPAQMKVERVRVFQGAPDPDEPDETQARLERIERRLDTVEGAVAKTSSTLTSGLSDLTARIDELDDIVDHHNLGSGA